MFCHRWGTQILLWLHLEDRGCCHRRLGQVHWRTLQLHKGQFHHCEQNKFFHLNISNLQAVKSGRSVGFALAVDLLSLVFSTGILEDLAFTGEMRSWLYCSRTGLPLLRWVESQRSLLRSSLRRLTCWPWRGREEPREDSAWGASHGQHQAVQGEGQPPWSPPQPQLYLCTHPSFGYQH